MVISVKSKRQIVMCNAAIDSRVVDRQQYSWKVLHDVGIQGVGFSSLGRVNRQGRKSLSDAIPTEGEGPIIGLGARSCFETRPQDFQHCWCCDMLTVGVKLNLERKF